MSEKLKSFDAVGTMAAVGCAPEQKAMAAYAMRSGNPRRDPYAEGLETGSRLGYRKGEYDVASHIKSILTTPIEDELGETAFPDRVRMQSIRAYIDMILEGK